MPICQNCSNPVGAKDKFCPYCDSPIEVAYSPTTDSGGKILAASSQISAVVKRYRDAYLVANVVDGVGSLSKGIGIVIAGVLVLVGLISAGSGRGGDTAVAMGVVIIALGVATGAWFYVLGILVAAQGQILKASLDGAVNGSPFLTNEHRAKIMSLPEA
jgi:RNA polymerase subunit RPABC4/transcription elongation factor Spt4